MAYAPTRFSLDFLRAQDVRDADPRRHRPLELLDHGAEVVQLIDALSASGASLTAHLPPDLFAPRQEESEQRQEITLPWGQTGEVRVHFAATRSGDTGLMRLATRDVVTMLEGEERRSTERWELFAA